MAATPDRDVLTDLFDVVMLNRYYGWYVNSGDLASAEVALEAEIAAWVEAYDKPIVFTEYGGDTMPGLHDVVPTRGPRSTRSSCSTSSTASSTASTRSSASTSGTSPTSPPRPGVMRVDGNKKGVFTRERRPKAAAHLLRRRWRV